MESKLITRITRDSTLDGPGCRYTIFVKGCNLRCPWCHNPETQLSEQEILFYGKNCINCKNCIKYLKNKINENVEDPFEALQQAKPLTQEETEELINLCPTGAMEPAAKLYTTEWLLNDIEKYRTVYDRTGGGVTISGGDPLLSKDFVFELFSKAKEKGFHTALDTSASLEWSNLKELLPVVDLWLVDIKHMHDESLKTDLVKSNLKKLCDNKANIQIRIPVIPNYNNKVQLLEEMAEFVYSLKDSITMIDLLPFHSFAVSKYDAMDKKYAFKKDDKLPEGQMDTFKAIFLNYFSEDKVNVGRNIVNG